MTKITKKEFLAYEDIRQSGVTNMFDARMVSALSGLSREKIIQIMKEYNVLSNKYLSKKR